MRKVLILPTLVLAACSTVPAEGNGAVPGGVCKDDGLGSFVGRDATTETGAELLKQHGRIDDYVIEVLSRSRWRGRLSRWRRGCARAGRSPWWWPISILEITDRRTR